MTKDTTTAKKANLATYLKGVKREMKKVIWPTPKQLLSYTSIVLGISIFVSLLVYLLDFLIAQGYSQFL